MINKSIRIFNNSITILLIIGLFTNFKYSVVEQNPKVKKVIFKSVDSNLFIFRSFNVFLENVDSNIYIEHGILCMDSSKKCTLKYKKLKKEGWQIWNGDQWKLLFDTNNKIQVVHLFDKDKTIIPSSKYKYFGDTLYSFTCKNEELSYNGDNNSYLFSLSNGIVIVKNVSTYFKRSDYFFNKWDTLRIIE